MQEPWVRRNEILPLSVETRVLASDVEPLRVASVERFDHATIGPDQMYSAMTISTTAQLFAVLLSIVRPAERHRVRLVGHSTMDPRLYTAASQNSAGTSQPRKPHRIANS